MNQATLDADLLRELARHAGEADAARSWPQASWEVLHKLGGLGWPIPKRFGGEELSGRALLQRHGQLAGACLTTCFLLSQRDAACRRLLGSDRDDLCQQLIPSLVKGETFITVGLAQLTTSRQYGKPAVSAEIAGDSIIIDGTIPWVTGAARADHIVAGAVIESGEQILVILPMNSAGVSVGEPAELAALEGSLTAEVRCSQVHVDRHWLLAGPAAQVLKGERGGTGGLETSCLALGLAGAALDYIGGESARRPELKPGHDRLAAAHERLQSELFQLADNKPSPEEAQSMRARANTLVLRATQAALSASKGAGFLRQHPAQRWARQALFFLVWSCPWAVSEATMACLIGGSDAW